MQLPRTVRTYKYNAREQQLRTEECDQTQQESQLGIMMLHSIFLPLWRVPTILVSAWNLLAGNDRFEETADCLEDGDQLAAQL